MNTKTTSLDQLLAGLRERENRRYQALEPLNDAAEASGDYRRYDEAKWDADLESLQDYGALRRGVEQVIAHAREIRSTETEQGRAAGSADLAALLRDILG